MKKKLHLPVLDKASLILSIALIMCLLPFPYGFSTIIRLATSVIALCWAYRFYNRRKVALAIISGAIALLFQPFYKIALDRLTWNIVDVVLAVVIIYLVLNKKY